MTLDQSSVLAPNNENVAVISVNPDPGINSATSGLHAVIRSADSYTAFFAPSASQRKKILQQKTVGSAGNVQANLHEIERSGNLDDLAFRKLINESAQTFLKLHGADVGGENGVDKTFSSSDLSKSEKFAKISRQYRSILRDCCETTTTTSDGEDGSQVILELLYKLELVWNLVEIISIDKAPNSIVTPQLLQWVGYHFPQADEKAASCIRDYESPEMNPEYWDAVILYIIQGEPEKARKLLQLHSKYLDTNESFESMDELLRKMPIYRGIQAGEDSNNKESAIEFEVRFKHWKREIATRIEEGDFHSNEGLAEVAAVLSGSFRALEKLVPKCETWYQWLIGQMLLTSPTMKSYDLADAASSAINLFAGTSKMTSLDAIVLAVFEEDYTQVMHELVSTLGNLWFPAHLLDLLVQVDPEIIAANPTANSNDTTRFGLGRDNLTSSQYSLSLREHLLLEYATSLMSHHSLWQLGVLYFDKCPTQGKFRCELMLERISPDSEFKANKIIKMAADRGMTRVVSSVCKVMGMKSIKSSSKNNIGSAMTWALRSMDVQFTTFLADRLLRQYCEEGSFSSEDLLDNLGTSMAVSDRLTFLAKYREFHRLCSEVGDFEAAANLLHSLMWSRLAPKYFWVTLLIDAMPFLSPSASEGSQNSSPLLTSAQTYELMDCLRELSSDKESLPKKQRILLNEHESQIKLHLVKNLAVALMDEGDDSSSTLIRA